MLSRSPRRGFRAYLANPSGVKGNAVLADALHPFVDVDQMQEYRITKRKGNQIYIEVSALEEPDDEKVAH